MATFIYDEALVKKFNSWTSSENIHVYGPNETSRMFEVMADESGDESIKFPIIYLERNRSYRLINNAQTKRPLSYDGSLLNQFDDSAQMLNGLPISLDYVVNVYAKQAKQADILMRNLLFNIINYPGFEVVVPNVRIYNEETEDYETFSHTARMELSSNDIQDNSNEQQRFIEGNYTKLSALISVNDAYLWDVRQHRNAEIEIRIDDNIDFKN